ncbi:MAG: hypothetical protein ABI789_06625, partial [Usitatibacter sp.]
MLLFSATPGACAKAETASDAASIDETKQERRISTTSSFPLNLGFPERVYIDSINARGADDGHSGSCESVRERRTLVEPDVA